MLPIRFCRLAALLERRPRSSAGVADPSVHHTSHHAIRNSYSKINKPVLDVAAASEQNDGGCKVVRGGSADEGKEILIE